MQKIFNDIVPLDKTLTPVRQDGVFFRISINLQQKNIEYVRRAYTFLDALGDIGGLREGLFLIFATFISPFYHQIWAYDIFSHHQEYLPKSKRKEIKTSFKLKWFFQDCFPECLFKCLCCRTNWKKYEKLQKKIERQSTITLEKLVQSGDLGADSSEEENQSQTVQEILQKKIQRRLSEAISRKMKAGSETGISSETRIANATQIKAFETPIPYNYKQETSLKSPSNELTMRNLVTNDKNTAFSPNIVPELDKRPSYKEQRDSVKTKRSQRSHSIKARSKPTSETKN